MEMMLLTGGMLAIAFMSDVIQQRIPNLLCAAGFVAGVGLHGAFSGVAGASNALIGALLGFSPLLVLYVLRAVGAGDVKLFAAIGALAGAEFVLQCLMYSLIYAAVIGCMILCWRCEWKIRGTAVMMFLLRFVVWKQVEAAAGFRSAGQHLRFPFMWAVLPAAITVFYQINV